MEKTGRKKETRRKYTTEYEKGKRRTCGRQRNCLG